MRVNGIVFAVLLGGLTGSAMAQLSSGRRGAGQRPVTPPPATRPALIAPQPNEVRGDEITDRQKQAVEKGLRFLAGHQAPNGAYNSGAGPHAGITALAGLAFMEAGNLPGRGKYADNVSRCVDYVLASTQESGLISSDPGRGPMYGHGFATLFLGEVYGMTGDDRIKEKLQKAVRLIETTQNPEGGWRYMPVPADADISVTICQVMGLRAARDAGIKVEKDVIDKAIKYVLACQNIDGGFSYQASGMGGFGGGRGGMNNSGFGRSAAGVTSLYYAGVFEGDSLQRGLKYLMTNWHPVQGIQSAQSEGHYYYGNYYSVQAMFLAGGDYWASWYPAIRDQLISRQATAGNWESDGDGDAGQDYATSMALIIIQMPNRYLPVFTGKGPGG